MYAQLSIFFMLLFCFNPHYLSHKLLGISKSVSSIIFLKPYKIVQIEIIACANEMAALISP